MKVGDRVEQLLKIENLYKTFTIHNLGKHIKASQNINISLNKGEFIGITGKSGSGKSTILKCIYRTYTTDEGSIWYESKKFGLINILDISERQMLYLRKYEIGYVSQFLNSMPRTTAKEIVEHSVLEMGYSKEYASQEAEKMLGHFEFDRELWDSYPNNFSGGEKLRLNIAMAMVKHPRLLLLDEPTASLDNYSKEKVKELIKQLKIEGTTMIGIFHDIDFMEGLCDKKYNMQAGEFI
ncbi:phosphonate C-P lyase system protein PhnL [Clostridium pasteurianum]|uniref:ABC-type phosphonate transport system, ATPase component n=1 Tax=Clostridium pasteurianum BC1 TaxID=86416 RepID=R4K6Y3_CLOPA|nr:ATP-binding cassette domain-containing protein [Clostridium pasteurianum]AGK98323.1 ABC-type phosphonate transport system, ATPase component [Clostridium pasteurianum BC1]